MKKYIYIVACLLFGVQTFAQLPTLIGKKTTAYAGNTSVLMEFSNANKGLIVPYVTAAAATTAVNGTFIFDSSDKKMKLRQNGTWVDFTNTAPNANTVTVPAGTDDSTKKTVIGAKTSTVAGAVVLESTTQLMVLPQVTNPHTSIVNPTAGMMVYDPTNKMFCTYNGTQWSFWTYN